jgi:hypothetical protein
MTVDRLLTATEWLDAPQVELLCEMADALGWDIESWQNPESDLVGQGFGDAILNRIRLHHANSEEKLNKTSFEFAFKAAAQFAGRHAVLTRSHTFQGADIIVDNIRWSLKTEGSTNMSQSAITISKFSEARWIRDCLTEADFARETTFRISKHLSEYDRVLTLRGSYVDDGEQVMYELIEIPHQMLRAATYLKESAFSPRSKGGSSSAKVYWRDFHAFTVVLDGSVEKITIRNIQVEHCFTHARWVVPILPRIEG